MKAIVYTEYGPPEVLQVKEIEKPAPKGNEVLIKNYATSVTAGDVNARDFSYVPAGFGPLPRLMLGITGPRKPVIGADIAGEVEAVGDDVKQFKIGDRVFGIDGENLGAYAEYVCRPEDGALSIMPTNMNFEEAAAIPFGASTALYFLRNKGDIQRGHEVLINGASGGVGVYAVQLAKYFGAEVTGVCSAKNLDTVRSLGADKVIDYTQEDFTQNGETYDLIFDMVGKNTSFSRNKNSLKQNGCYLAVAGGLKEMLQMQWTNLVGDRKVIFGGGTASERKDYLIFFKELIEAGDLKAVIDGSYPFEQTAEAHRYYDDGRERGSVVITVEHSD
jgi:NADPH:quinone reductase-like Zn-dependent oxidoreductase